MADDMLTARFSDDEFERMIGSNAFGDIRLELRGGVLHRMNAQYLPHAQTKQALAHRLENAIQRAGLSLEIVVEVSVRFGGGFMPLPDIVVFRPIAAQQALPGEAVALIVEIADTTLGDDLGSKLRSYARAGVAEYWVVDVGGGVAHQSWGPQDDGFAHRRVVPLNSQLSSATIAGLGAI